MGTGSEPWERSASGLGVVRLGTDRTGAAPVLLLHGIPGSGASWMPVARLLADDHEVLVVDLLGFGASARPRGLDALHASAQATAVADLLDELGIEAATVVGHDFGGPVALALADRRPSLVAAVGLLATNAFPDTPIPFPLRAVCWPMVGAAAARLLFSGPSLGLMLRQGVGRPHVALDRAAHLGDRDQRRAIATIFGGSLVRLGELYRPIEAALRSLRCPTFVGWGDGDPFFALDHGVRTADAAGAQLRVYPGAGHFLPEERPNDVATDLAALVRASVA